MSSVLDQALGSRRPSSGGGGGGGNSALGACSTKFWRPQIFEACSVPDRWAADAPQAFQDDYRSSAKGGTHLVKLWRCWTLPAKVGRIRARIGQRGSNVGQCQAKFGAHIGRTRDTLGVDVRRKWPDPAPSSPKLAQIRPRAAQPVQSWPKLRDRFRDSLMVGVWALDRNPPNHTKVNIPDMAAQGSPSLGGRGVRPQDGDLRSGSKELARCFAQPQPYYQERLTPNRPTPPPIHVFTSSMIPAAPGITAGHGIGAVHGAATGRGIGAGHTARSRRTACKVVPTSKRSVGSFLGLEQTAPDTGASTSTRSRATPTTVRVVVTSRAARALIELWRSRGRRGDPGGDGGTGPELSRSHCA